MSKKNHKHRNNGFERGLDKLVPCPSCGAMSYVQEFDNPRNEVEQMAIICSSCKRDIYPIIKAFEAMQQQDKEGEEN
jgi:uncharacterized protein YbaR (Trm112 family)